eukprot:GHVH01006276.1.p1 GENE.GHVH01006276.1~~GHVH01006276.1.p1  ORF type:complete len:389 (+),score=41.16 GHVH01006276.1:196-1362(+)
MPMVHSRSENAIAAYSSKDAFLSLNPPPAKANERGRFISFNDEISFDETSTILDPLFCQLSEGDELSIASDCHSHRPLTEVVSSSDSVELNRYSSTPAVKHLDRRERGIHEGRRSEAYTLHRAESTVPVPTPVLKSTFGSSYSFRCLTSHKDSEVEEGWGDRHVSFVSGPPVELPYPSGNTKSARSSRRVSVLKRSQINITCFGPSYRGVLLSELGALEYFLRLPCNNSMGSLSSPKPTPRSGTARSSPQLLIKLKKILSSHPNIISMNRSYREVVQVYQDPCRENDRHNLFLIYNNGHQSVSSTNNCTIQIFPSHSHIQISKFRKAMLSMMNPNIPVRKTQSQFTIVAIGLLGPPPKMKSMPWKTQMNHSIERKMKILNLNSSFVMR